MQINISPKKRTRGIWLILAAGIALFLWQLGSTGLVDETPPLFASAARRMAATGDWLTPRVNGLPRYDKPPLVYWLMAFLYGLPGHNIWDPLGTWAARIPSALSTIALMCVLGDTVMRFPQPGDLYPRKTALAVAMAFGLSPLVLLWGRTAVSDPLLCSTLGLSLLFHWRRYALNNGQPWWLAWTFLGLAVLTKGPVAIILTGLVLFLFAFLQRDLKRLWQRLLPLKGLIVALIIALPWYLIELIVEREPFWNSFFGYHNLQRFTSVVNSHSQPWWFFFPVMLLASLPFTPFLFVGLWQTLAGVHFGSSKLQLEPSNSLKYFAVSWLLSVLLFFTFAATKLPSYWLPATPASALLIGLSFTSSFGKGKGGKFAWLLTSLILLLLSLALWLSSLWIPFIQDPEMPGLGVELIKSKLLFRGAFIFSISFFVGVLCIFNYKYKWLISIQGLVFFFCITTFLPLWSLGDKLRHLPVRQAALVLLNNQKPQEPIAMVGIMKPSLHFYTNRVVIYEGRSEQALVNLDDRLRNERRVHYLLEPQLINDVFSSVLLVIDKGTSEMNYWKDLKPEILADIGIYRLWRIDLERLRLRASHLRSKGTIPDWMNPRPERY